MFVNKGWFRLHQCLRRVRFSVRENNLGQVVVWEPVRNQRRCLSNSPKYSALLFPGQGSQYAGMCRGLLHNSRVTELFQKAESILGYNILELCTSGPTNVLNKTEFCQPAVFLSSLAALECFAETRSELSVFNGLGPSGELTAAAGFSVGEFAALVFGRAISFDDALHVIHIRAQAMQMASEAVPSGMVSVTGLDQEQINSLCDIAKKQTIECFQGQQPVAVISSYLFPKGFVIAGVEATLHFIEKLAITEFGATRLQRLPVSGAFHSVIMEPAQSALKEALNKVEIKLPQIPVYSNVTAQPYTSPEEIRRLLVQQLIEPVKWHQTILNMFNKWGTITAYEVGPQHQLKSVMSHINRRALKNFISVEA